MQATLALATEDGDPANCSLRISKLQDGRVQICRVSSAGAPLGASADVSAQTLAALENLGFGQICWLPNPDEPTFRMTGLGKNIEIRENRAGSEALIASADHLRDMLKQI